MIRLLDSVQSNGGPFAQVTALVATTGAFPLLASGTTLSTFANRLFLTPSARVGLSLSDPYQVQPNVIPFIVRISGVFTTGNASDSVQISVMQNTTAGAGALLLSYTAGNTISTSSCNFFIEQQMQWDATSQTLEGQGWGVNHGVLKSPTVTASAASLTTFGLVSLSLTAVVAVSSLSDTITITEFSLNLL